MALKIILKLQSLILETLKQAVLMTNILRRLTEDLRENIYSSIRMRNVYLQVTNALYFWV